MAIRTNKTKPTKHQAKKQSVRQNIKRVCGDNTWTVVRGELGRPRGRPNNVRSLFRVIGEKIPFDYLPNVEQKFKVDRIKPTGVYIAHDSMGYPRYIGRGNIFSRLRARKRAQILELSYFSFFVVESKVHEREIETIMIRGAGPLLDFNSRKVRNDIQPGNVRDFEPGTKFFERQHTRGKKAKRGKDKKG